MIPMEITAYNLSSGFNETIGRYKTGRYKKEYCFSGIWHQGTSLEITEEKNRKIKWERRRLFFHL
jgi:hypothetical protein